MSIFLSGKVVFSPQVICTNFCHLDLADFLAASAAYLACKARGPATIIWALNQSSPPIMWAQVPPLPLKMIATKCTDMYYWVYITVYITVYTQTF
jgi:hypothetical protein